MSLLSNSLATAYMGLQKYELPVKQELEELKSNGLTMQNGPPVQDMAAGGDALWITGKDQRIYKKVNQQWEQYPGAALRISVDGSGIPYIINTGHHIQKWNQESKNWVDLQGPEASDIGVGFDGDLWAIGTSDHGYGYFHYIDGSWEKRIRGNAVGIAVGPTGPWIVNRRGKIYQRLKNKWVSRPGPRANDIGAGPGGQVWIIGQHPYSGNGGIWSYNGHGWDQASGGGTNVAVDLYGNPYVSNNVGQTFWRNQVHTKKPMTEINNTGIVNVNQNNIISHYKLDFQHVGGKMTVQNHYLKDLEIFTTKAGKRIWIRNQGKSSNGPWGGVNYQTLI